MSVNILKHIPKSNPGLEQLLFIAVHFSELTKQEGTTGFSHIPGKS